MTILCGDVNYGGRGTDDKDRRSLMVILESYITPKVMDDDYRYSPSGTYYIPEDSPDRQHYLDYLSSLPQTPAPEVFGLHDNAAITCAQNEMLDMFKTIVSLGGGGGGGGSGKEEMIQARCEDFLKTIPTPLNEMDVFEKYPTVYSECMNTVITQEVVRYNALLAVIHSSCKEIVRALQGLVVMSGELEVACNSIGNNQVPTMWESVAYPSMKPLAAWSADLKERMSFIMTWIDKGSPSSFWMSGFFFPQAFLTGVRQNYARKHKLAVDTIDYNFHIMVEEDPDDKPEAGCYVHGMFIEAAVWDTETLSITDPRPKELFCSFPMIWLECKQHREAPDSGIYMCPLYKVPSRTGTLSTTGHSTNFVMFMELPSDRTEEGWIRGGVAMFLSLRY